MTNATGIKKHIEEYLASHDYECDLGKEFIPDIERLVDFYEGEYERFEERGILLRWILLLYLHAKFGYNSDFLKIQLESLESNFPLAQIQLKAK